MPTDVLRIERFRQYSTSLAGYLLALASGVAVVAAAWFATTALDGGIRSGNDGSSGITPKECSIWASIAFAISVVEFSGFLGLRSRVRHLETTRSRSMLWFNQLFHVGVSVFALLEAVAEPAARLPAGVVAILCAISVAGVATARRG